MTLNKFIQGVRKTKPPKKNALLIATLGVGTEAAEIQDIVKRKLKYNEPIDDSHLMEEVGDVLNYLVQLTDSQGIKLEDCMRSNLDKMRKRYPNGFSKKAGIERKDKK